MAAHDRHLLPDALGRAVQARYTALADTPGSLSCGGALDVAEPLPGETVVDLGCGSGRDVVRAAAMIGPGGLAIGVDANEAMLAAARRRAGSLSRARFIRCDLAAVALPDARADVIVSSCAVNHAPDKLAVYREIRRLLRPGGRFAVSDVVAERELPEAVRRDPAAWAACYGGAIPESEVLAAMAAARLTHVRVVQRTAPYEKGGVRVLSLTIEGRRR
jgi:arsenite methyltransferase